MQQIVIPERDISNLWAGKLAFGGFIHSINPDKHNPQNGTVTVNTLPGIDNSKGNKSIRVANTSPFYEGQFYEPARNRNTLIIRSIVKDSDGTGGELF